MIAQKPHFLFNQNQRAEASTGLGYFIRLLIGLCLTASIQAYANKDFSLQDAPGGIYKIDKTHAYVTFSYSHQGYSKPWLRFRSVDATLDLHEESLNKSSLEVSIDPSSIDSGVDLFDKKLKEKNHFDVENYPAITFIASEIDVDDNNVVVTGNLSLKGKQDNITLVGTFNRGGLHFLNKKPVLGFSAKTQLKRSEWGLGYAVPMVGDDVEIVIEVEFIRVKPLKKVKGQHLLN